MRRKLDDEVRADLASGVVDSITCRPTAAVLRSCRPLAGEVAYLQIGPVEVLCLHLWRCSPPAQGLELIVLATCGEFLIRFSREPLPVVPPRAARHLQLTPLRDAGWVLTFEAPAQDLVSLLERKPLRRELAHPAFVDRG